MAAKRSLLKENSTLLDVGLSIVPIVEVGSRIAFAAKISALVAVTNAIGLLIYRRTRIAERA